MKRILFILFCAVSLAASAQNYPWSGTFTLGATTADTTIIWAEKFRSNIPWALEIEYETLDSTISFAIVTSNSYSGAFSYWPNFSGGTFPVKLDPVADAYYNPTGKIHASRTFKDSDITFIRFGIMFIKQGSRTGSVPYSLKQ